MDGGIFNALVLYALLKKLVAHFPNLSSAADQRLNRNILVVSCLRAYTILIEFILQLSGRTTA